MAEGRNAPWEDGKIDGQHLGGKNAYVCTFHQRIHEVGCFFKLEGTPSNTTRADSGGTSSLPPECRYAS